MEDALSKAGSMLGWAVILAGTKLIFQPDLLDGAVPWYLAGALCVFGVFTIFSDEAKSKAAATSRFRDKVLSATIADTAGLVRNFAIAAGIVLVIQALLYLFGSDVDPSGLGTLEQRVWETLEGLKWIGSLGVAASMTGAVILLSLFLHSSQPLRLAAGFRKAVAWCAALLASLMMFTFVVAEASDASHERLTGPIRAEIAISLTRAAAARKQAAAYRWISQTVSRMEVERPEEIEAIRSYFAEGERICDEFEQTYVRAAAEVPVGEPVQRVGIISGLPLPSQVLPHPQSPGAGFAQNLHLCHKPRQFTALVEHLVSVPYTAGPAPDPFPPGGLPNSDPQDGSPEEKTSYTDSVWLPEFAGRLSDKAGAATDPWSDVPLTAADEIPVDPTVEVTTASWSELRELRASAERAATDAEATRTALRGLATKSAAKLIGKAFAIDGVAGELVDSLRNAVLAELAQRGQDRLKAWLSRNSQREGIVAAASGFMERMLFPELPLEAAVVAAEGAQRAEARQVWDSAHPEATTTVAVIAAARAAAVAAARAPPTPHRPYGSGLRPIGAEPRPGAFKPRPAPRPRPPVIRP